MFTLHYASQPASDSAISTTIGNQVRELRTKAGLSVTRLASLSGISQPHLSQIERGQASPSMSTIYRLAKHLGIRPGDLLPPLLDHDDCIVVRHDEGELLPVSDHPNTSYSRTLLFDSTLPLQVFEYIMEPDQYIGDWFDPSGVRGIYVVTGVLQIEVAGHGTFTLGPRDFISLSNNVSDRWSIVGDAAVHVLFASVLSAARTEQ